MDKDRIEGTVKKVTGTVKDAVGKATGDANLQAEGKAEKATGTVQNAVGTIKDAARDILKK
ncbi:MAG TPA: CsbD family protein [Acidocella sp.]|nr:CsbD family protein [Acidocella sp.]HQT40176.1 CsbD family protein [Acidocella sp.]